MRHRFSSVWGSAPMLLLIVLLSVLTGCGTFRVAGAINFSNTSVSTGTVSFVHFTAIFGDRGTLINVTVVTLVAPPVTNTFTFCGNQSSQFTMNSAVQVSFTPGQSCSNLVAVTPH
jgi:hypothetical protein